VLSPVTKQPQQKPTLPGRLDKATTDVIEATISYRAALERVLAIHERELARRMELVSLRQDLFKRGVMNRQEFEEGQLALDEAQRNAADTRRSIAEADRMLTEARDLAAAKEEAR
jgi:multidrug resistance efflux pump